MKKAPVLLVDQENEQKIYNSRHGLTVALFLIIYQQEMNHLPLSLKLSWVVVQLLSYVLQHFGTGTSGRLSGLAANLELA